MATLLPPPKRQKLYHGIPEPKVEEPVKRAPNILVKFVQEDSDEALAPPVSLPADVSREGLEALVNKLSSKVSLTNCTISQIFIL